ncbi:MAG: hypothetical protein HY608_10265 [Planctomycetes bacterium]|nr:hypothetical protein [Planctomycetota bacterium]
MGGLVARAHVEDDRRYRGDVERLLQVAPPNHGSDLARVRVLLELWEHRDAREDTGRVAASIGDGLGQAGDDLTPGSAFLERLNAGGRRAGVRYAILAGTRGLLTEEEARAWSGRLTSMAGTDTTLRAALLRRAADEVAQHEEFRHGVGDLAVSTRSARLEGAHAYEEIDATHLTIDRRGADGTIPCLPFLLRELTAERE